VKRRKISPRFMNYSFLIAAFSLVFALVFVLRLRVAFAFVVRVAFAAVTARLCLRRGPWVCWT
jgi:hypothetical protein